MSTRRQLFRAMIVGAASLPFAALAQSQNSQGNQGGNGNHWGWANGNQGNGNNGNGNGNQNGNGGNNSGGGSGNGGSVRQWAGCLLKGTVVSTPAGERPVDDLSIGDEVLTLSGPKSVKWIGYDKFKKAEQASWLSTVMPIRLTRFALGPQSPRTDLYVSPLHCVYFNETLIPAKYLVNGRSITRDVPAGMDTLEYYHIDLGTHEVLFAEGAPVESFWDGVSGRESFANFVQYLRLYGAEPTRMKPFAPVLGRNRPQRMIAGMRVLVSNVVDVRDPIQIAHDQIARRAEALFV